MSTPPPSATRASCATATCYAYWGIWCALLRLPLWLVRRLDLDMTAWSCLAAVCLAGAAKIRTLLFLRSHTPSSPVVRQALQTHAALPRLRRQRDRLPQSLHLPGDRLLGRGLRRHLRLLLPLSASFARPLAAARSAAWRSAPDSPCSPASLPASASASHFFCCCSFSRFTRPASNRTRVSPPARTSSPRSSPAPASSTTAAGAIPPPSPTTPSTS